MTNEEAIGYMLVSCSRAGINLIDAEILMKEMRSAFDELTPEEAEERGAEWYRMKWQGPKK